MSDIETVLADLCAELYERGITLEHIKLDKPLFIEGNEIKTILGVEVKTVIYEDDATHWRRATLNQQLNKGDK